MSRPIVKSKPASRHGNHVAVSTPLARLAKRALARAETTREVQSLTSRLRTGIAGARTRAKRVAKAVSKQAARADKTIRAKPYHSIGVAAGAGLVAGYLIARRRPAPAPSN
jgi:ElaB/YqjD/DUF883 family membrane-anchored ribosome-binding protein